MNNDINNNNNGNLCSAFGNSKRFTIKLKCGTHEKKRRRNTAREKKISNVIIDINKWKKQACYQKYNEMHAHKQAVTHTDRQTDRQTDINTHTHTHTHTHAHTHTHTHTHTQTFPA